MNKAIKNGNSPLTVSSPPTISPEEKVNCPQFCDFDGKQKIVNKIEMQRIESFIFY